MGDFSAGKEKMQLANRKKVNINKINFNAVLADINPQANIIALNTLAGDDSEMRVALNFKSMKDFSPESVARQIPELQALMAMRNLLRDLKSNLLDNGAFRRELEKILKDESLSGSLRADLGRIASIEMQPDNG